MGRGSSVPHANAGAARQAGRRPLVSDSPAPPSPWFLSGLTEGATAALAGVGRPQAILLADSHKQGHSSGTLKELLSKESLKLSSRQPPHPPNLTTSVPPPPPPPPETAPSPPRQQQRHTTSPPRRVTARGWIKHVPHLPEIENAAPDATHGKPRHLIARARPVNTRTSENQGSCKKLSGLHIAIPES
ncbi:ran-binding protein 9-like [Portunus trituberculatus]|uniref:ran-binding protein 9-like n=1 Tax=Portunus trituberculatus TaxID=210409 RepID=UPI001E1D103B|nr:ran-binding protein 9-like [Portunus trituberculatus]